jgi:PPE-repeat protein
MDFAILPPEINSGRMYAGPGSGPMLAAAMAWDGLADELYAAASSYQSVVSELVAGTWSGPSSVSMAAAAASYAGWLSATAAQAEETATRAKAAVAAYEAAFMSTVPPPVIAANRSLLMALVATNFFGQNTPAIAATEAQYAEMWAQDAVAMYSYAGSSAAATTLTPFTPPQQNTNPSGSAGQAAAAGQAMATPAGNAQSIVSGVPQTFSAVPNALQSLATAAPAAAADPTSPLDAISDLLTIFVDVPADLVGIFVAVPLSVIALVSFPFDVSSYLVSAHTDDTISGWNGEVSWPGSGPAPVREFPAPLTGPRPAVVSAPTVSAGLGEANTVGALSVPPMWTVATPAVRPIAVTLPALSAATAGEPGEVVSGSTLSEMALAGMAGRAMAGTIGARGGRDGGKAPKGVHAAARAAGAVTGDSAAADGEGEVSQSEPRTVVTGVAAELREFAKLRDEGILTDEEYTEQKNRLLGR